MRKRDFIANVSNWTGVNMAVMYLRRLSARRLPVLAYHRILPPLQDVEFPFDPHLVSATVEDFRWQVRYVKKHFSPLTFKQLIEHLDGNCSLPSNAIIITFDDGYDDNYHFAFPILAEEQVPATFFISSGYVGNDQPFWFDWLSAIIVNSSSKSLESNFLPGPIHVPDDTQGRRSAYLQVVEEFKKLSNDARLSVLENLNQKYGRFYEQLPESTKAMSRPMTVANLKEMASSGMEIGSHTVSHPILAQLSIDEVRHELTNSRKLLQEWSGQDVSVLAYPNGGSNDFTNDVIAVAKSCGYRLGISYLPGDNQLDKLAHFGIRRIAIESDIDKPLFGLALAAPGLVS